MHFFGCLFALFLGILFIGLAFVGSILNFVLSLLGFKKRVTGPRGFGGQQGGFGSQQNGFGGFGSSNQRDDFESVDNSGRYGGSQSPNQSSKNQQTTGQQIHKIFEKDDSEYVDFEEV